MEKEKDFETYLEAIRGYAAEEGFETLDETYVEHLKCRYFGREVVIGRSERILLREIKMSDLESFYAFSDAGEEPVLKAFLKDSPEASRKHLQDYISHMYPLYDYGIWTVERLRDGEIIGLCGFGRSLIGGEECTDLGYYICPEFRRQGLAAECIEIALDYGERYLGFHGIYATVRKENGISQGILQRFGFHPVSMCSDPEGDVLVYRKIISAGWES